MPFPSPLLWLKRGCSKPGGGGGARAWGAGGSCRRYGRAGSRGDRSSLEDLLSPASPEPQKWHLPVLQVGTQQSLATKGGSVSAAAQLWWLEPAMAVTHLLPPLPRLLVLGWGDGGGQLPSITLENQVSSLLYPLHVTWAEPFGPLVCHSTRTKKKEYLKVFLNAAHLKFDRNGSCLL